MLKIKFHPDSDVRDLQVATESYGDIWEKEGEKIVKSIEKVSGLKFKETYINAVVFLAKLPSRSYPLSLKTNLPNERKRATLVHELCHRILAANHIGPPKDQFKTENERVLEVHKILYLILYDVWCDLYGEEFAKKSAQIESGTEKVNVYKKAWKWALSMNQRQRSRLFSNLRKKIG
jgi:hypothetical protein